MTIVHVIFYVFSAFAVLSALMVVGAKNPVHGVLFLVMTFFSMAGLWILLHAEFLALILVLVYVGAVMTLFLFVVMMLDIDVVGLREGFVRYLPLGALIICLLVGIVVLAIGPRFGLINLPVPSPVPADYSNTVELGSVLYTDFAYPFEIAAVLLLTAIVAAICLTHRVKRKMHKTQNIAAQLAVQKDQRVRLLKMPSEKKFKPGAPL